MLKFCFKLLLLFSTLLFGLLLGIQQAEYNIFSVQGIKAETEKAEKQSKEDQAEEEQVFIKKIDEDGVEYGIVGQNFSLKMLEEKEAEWNRKYQHNRYSHLGHRLGDKVYSFSKQCVDMFLRVFDKLLQV